MRLGVENAPNEGDIKVHVEGGVEGANDDSCRIPKECCFFLPKLRGIVARKMTNFR